VEAWSKAIAGIGGALVAVASAFGLLWRPVHRWLARRRARRELVDLAVSSVGDLLDGQVLMLKNRLPLVGEWRPGEDELLYKLGQLLDRREAFFLAQGYRPTLPQPKQLALARPDGTVATSVEEVHRRTQRIRLAQERAERSKALDLTTGEQDMFRDGDLE